MRHLGLIVAAPVAALLLAACGDEQAPMSATPSDTPSSAGTDQLHTGFFTVLESGEHGPQLCVNVLSSNPPQCGGPDVLGWSWADVEGVESLDGVTWGFYSVTGTWDGSALTLTEPPLSGAATSPMVPEDTLPDFSSPCEPPAGGWAVVDPATATHAGDAAAGEYASAQPDWAGTWVDEGAFPEDADEPVYNPATFVLNVQFTGDLERHEAALRDVWGGPLCVSTAEHSMQDLTAIQEELTTAVPGMNGVGIDVLTNRVDLDVFVEDGLQEQLDEQYGAGLVHVTASLRPVE